MDELLNTIYDNAVADMENAFVKMLGNKKCQINTDKRMKSVFGSIELIDIVPNDYCVDVVFFNEDGKEQTEQLTDFSLTDIIGIGEFVDDYGIMVAI